MVRLTIASLLGILVLWGSNPASAHVWKCQTPQGAMWTDQPSAMDDCQEYDAVYNPSAAPPASTSVSAQVIVPVPVPAPYVAPPVYTPYYYAPGYYAPGAVIVRPLFGYPYEIGRAHV